MTSLLQTFNETNIKQDNGRIILSLADWNGQLITGQISLEQLLNLYREIEGIIDPQKKFKEHLKELKRFKREVFTHYRQEQDPKLKEQRLNLYIEAKRMVMELEEGLKE